MNPGDEKEKKSDEKHESSGHSHSEEYAPYPKLDLSSDFDAPNPSSNQQQQQQQQHGAENWGTFVRGSDVPPSNAYGSVPATTLPSESNPYVSPAPVPAKNTVDTVKDVLGKWGKKVGDATKKAEDLAGNVWQHLKTGPSVADAAMGRIAQGTKVIAEGGYEKIFRQTFETVPEEQLQKSYACYLSTSAGPVMGTLYLSTAKLAFCSDNPLSYQVGDKTEWSYYKVVIPRYQLRSVNPSASKVNSAEKYIQITSVDNHEFWFMGFVNYGNAVKHLQDAVVGHSSQSSV